MLVYLQNLRTLSGVFFLSFVCRTMELHKFFILGLFQNWNPYFHFPADHYPVLHFPADYFPVDHFPEYTFPRIHISPITFPRVIFPRVTFPRITSSSQISPSHISRHIFLWVFYICFFSKKLCARTYFIGNRTIPRIFISAWTIFPRPISPRPISPRTISSWTISPRTISPYSYFPEYTFPRVTFSRTE
jgi:hypothetical protein